MIYSTLKSPYPAWLVAAITLAVAIVLLWLGPVWKGVVLLAVSAVIALWAVFRSTR